MRSTTFALASLLSLVASVAAAPVTAPGQALKLRALEPVVEDVVAAVVENEEPVSDEVEESNEDETFHALDKRAQTCSKVSQCKNTVPSNASRICSSKKCSWACKSGYKQSGSKCVKKATTSTGTQLVATKQIYTGKGTWYTQNGVAGSCGKVNSDSAMIVAMNTPQKSGSCGKYVTVKNQANGKSIRALVADECPSCAWGSLDLSTGAFKALASLDTGLIGITWQYS
ncbi:hypothetical protein JCM10207_007699 [Rhodosporidiobolus poonsookiae]